MARPDSCSGAPSIFLGRNLQPAVVMTNLLRTALNTNAHSGLVADFSDLVANETDKRSKLIAWLKSKCQWNPQMS
jgi:hypothetical protein